MIRYYILNKQYNEGPVKGDVLVWEGDYWALDRSNDTLLVRYLWVLEGFYFTIPREHLIEFVPETDLEDARLKRDLPKEKKIWNFLKNE